MSERDSINSKTSIVLIGCHVDVQYVVDFAPELYEIITETKYMEQLGFHVPELARNVSLQVGRGLYTCHREPYPGMVHLAFRFKTYGRCLSCELEVPSRHILIS